MKKYRTVVVDGETKRVPFNKARVPASERNAGLMPSRVEVPDTAYRRNPKHRYRQEEEV